MNSQQELEAQMRSLESSLARVSSVAEEQGRYLGQVSDNLHAQHVVPQKFRSHAVMLPAFASAPAQSVVMPTGAYGGSTPAGRDSPYVPARPPSTMLAGRPYADEMGALPGKSPSSLESS
eukprot:5157761-Prymnesium_polylepis.1